jgi:hypothetical protein
MTVQPPDTRVPMLAEAILCAERGWHVFPCNPKNKRPLTDNGFYDATRDPAMIEQWWKKWPRAMIAIRTGPESGFFAVDLDLDPEQQLDGVAKFAILQNGRALPDTITVATPRGGRHLWFAWADGVRNSESKLAPGVDVRGQGGYVIVPPSRTADGAEYQFLIGGLDGPAQAPQWLIDLILAKKPGRKSHTTSGDADNYGRAALERERDCHDVAAWETQCRAQCRSLQPRPTGRRRPPGRNRGARPALRRRTRLRPHQRRWRKGCRRHNQFRARRGHAGAAHRAGTRTQQRRQPRHDGRS